MRAARYGFPLTLAIIGGDPKRFKPYVTLYRQALSQMGLPALPIAVHSPGHLADTDQQAKETLPIQEVEVGKNALALRFDHIHVPECARAHVRNEPGSRGGYSLYVPEYYRPDRTWPLVMALHGGSGNGRGFLWSWLRDARSRGAILAAPTATGSTWALMGDDTDTPNLMRILESVRARWNVDSERMLLTGMSDGGTFCYVTGLDHASPFTHLAPVAATFHPLMAEMADADRLRGLPVHIVHGRLDWMFPVQVARQTAQALTAAGATVTYRELEDLSHTYPREMNAEILTWLNGGS